MWYVMAAGIGAALAGCEADVKTEVKNRVPTMPNDCTPQKDGGVKCPDGKIYIDDQTAAQRFGLKTPAPALPSEPVREDASQRTGLGHITDVMVKHQEVLNSDGWYLSFIFQQDDGYQREFFPVCHGQTLKANVHQTINFHWHPWENTPSNEHPNTVGCYQIDGFQTVTP